MKCINNTINHSNNISMPTETLHTAQTSASLLLPAEAEKPLITPAESGKYREFPCSFESADLETAAAANVEEIKQKRMNAYIRALTQIGSKMYSCNECGANLRATDKVIDCADCGAIICERCVRAGKVDDHVCMDDEDVEV